MILLSELQTVPHFEVAEVWLGTQTSTSWAVCFQLYWDAWRLHLSFSDRGTPTSPLESLRALRRYWDRYVYGFIIQKRQKFLSIFYNDDDECKLGFRILGSLWHCSLLARAFTTSFAGQRHTKSRLEIKRGDCDMVTWCSGNSPEQVWVRLSLWLSAAVPGTQFLPLSNSWMPVALFSNIFQYYWVFEII